MRKTSTTFSFLLSLHDLSGILTHNQNVRSFILFSALRDGICLPWGPGFFFSHGWSHSDGAVAQFNTPVLCETPSQPAADISVKFDLDSPVNFKFNPETTAWCQLTDAGVHSCNAASDL